VQNILSLSVKNLYYIALAPDVSNIVIGFRSLLKKLEALVFVLVSVLREQLQLDVGLVLEDAIVNGVNQEIIIAFISGSLKSSFSFRGLNYCFLCFLNTHPDLLKQS
jgi:hypothetical protein